MSKLNQIGELATEVLEYDFFYISGAQQKETELTRISGTISGRLGELNILLNQSFSYTGDDGNPSPRLGYEEGEILKSIYIRDYNKREAQKILRGIYVPDVLDDSNSEGDWVELREGDTVIKRSSASISNSANNKINASKSHQDVAKEMEAKIKSLVNAYNLYGSVPREAKGEDCIILKPEREES